MSGQGITIEDVERLPGVIRLEQHAEVGVTRIRLRAIPEAEAAARSYCLVIGSGLTAEVRVITSVASRDAFFTTPLIYAHPPGEIVRVLHENKFSLKWFGAGKNVAEATNVTAINRAIAEIIPLRGAVIYFTELFPINDTIVAVNGYGLTLKADPAAGSSIANASGGGLVMSDTVEKTILRISSTAGGELGLVVDGLYLYGNRFSGHTYAEILATLVSGEGHGIQLDRVSRVEIKSCMIWGVIRHGITGLGSGGTINLVDIHHNYVQDCGQKGIDLTNMADGRVCYNEVGTSGKGMYKASLDHHDTEPLGGSYPNLWDLLVSQGIFVGNHCNEIGGNRVYQTIGYNIYVLGDRNIIHHNLTDGATRTGIHLVSCQDNLIDANISYDNNVVYTPIGWTQELDAGRNVFDEVGCGIFVSQTAIKNNIQGNNCFTSVKSYGTELFRDGQINGISCRGHGNTIESNTCEGNSNDGIQIGGAGNDVLKNVCRFNAQRGINVTGVYVTPAIQQPNQVAYNVCRGNDKGIMVTMDGSAYIHDNDVAEIYGVTAVDSLAAEALGGDGIITLVNAAGWLQYDAVLIQCDATADRPVIWQANWVASKGLGEILVLCKPIIGRSALKIASIGNQIRKRRHTYGIHIVAGGAGVGAANVVLGENIFGNAITADLLVGAGATVTYDKYNSGVATVPNGATFIDVTHNMARTPSINDISFTPTNNLGNAVMGWLSGVSATVFRINVDVDPGAGTATFVWKINMNS